MSPFASRKSDLCFPNKSDHLNLNYKASLSNAKWLVVSKDFFISYVGQGQPYLSVPLRAKEMCNRIGFSKSLAQFNQEY